jgi:hypothetical protein
VVSFTAAAAGTTAGNSSSALWQWNVSFQETQAGSFYMDIFFREPGVMPAVATSRGKFQHQPFEFLTRAATADYASWR